jgi:hypothetical protein
MPPTKRGNLKLEVVIEALLSTRSVKEAAEKLGVRREVVSRYLGRPKAKKAWDDVCNGILNHTISKAKAASDMAFAKVMEKVERAKRDAVQLRASIFILQYNQTNGLQELWAKLDEIQKDNERANRELRETVLQRLEAERQENQRRLGLEPDGEIPEEAVRARPIEPDGGERQSGGVAEEIIAESFAGDDAVADGAGRVAEEPSK